jgi:hypothetical protein
MSYDVDVDGCPHCGAGAKEFNYTYNLSDMFHDLIPPQVEGGKGGIYGFDGIAAERVAEILKDALSKAEAMDPDEMAEKYNPENGWGSVASGLRFLREIRRACRAADPKSIVRCS